MKHIAHISRAVLAAAAALAHWPVAVAIAHPMDGAEASAAIAGCALLGRSATVDPRLPEAASVPDATNPRFAERDRRDAARWEASRRAEGAPGSLAAARKRPEATEGPRPKAPPAAAKPQEADWAGLERYRAENARVGLPQPVEERVVFFGDSITEGWASAQPAFFMGRPFLSRGISGQTTKQMVVRFEQDVIALRPRAVVILAGTNDIAGNTGPYREEETFANLRSMVELALANGIRPVLASVLPAREYPWRPGREPAPKIAALNARLRDYAQRREIVYLDFYSDMAGPGGGLKPELSQDGVHPNQAGYEVMRPLAERALQAALRSR